MLDTATEFLSDTDNLILVGALFIALSLFGFVADALRKLAGFALIAGVALIALNYLGIF